MDSKLVVKHHKPRRQVVIWLLVTLVSVAGAVALYEWGRYAGGYQRLEAQRELGLMSSELQNAGQRVAELRQQVALLERSRKIDQEAIDELRTALAEQQSEIQDLREELAFYQGIVSPSDGRQGLRIQRLELRRDGDSVRFELMLIQAMDHERRVSGRASLELVARDAQGQEVLVPMAQAVPAHPEGLEFGFRYYQALEGELVVPGGLEVTAVRVTLVPVGRGRSTITEDLDWDLER